MARFIRDVKLNKPIDVVGTIMEDFVYHNHYVRSDWNGEMVFSTVKSGTTSYMLYYYAAGILHIEAWSRNVIGGEASPDAAVKGEINRVIYDLKRISGEQLNNGHMGSDPLHHGGGHGDSHKSYERDTDWQNTSRTAPTGLGNKPTSPTNFGGLFVIFIFAFVMAAISPLWGLIMGLFILIKGLKGRPLLVFGGVIILGVTAIGVYEMLAPYLALGYSPEDILYYIFN